jgi:hypothetical protein
VPPAISAAGPIGCAKKQPVPVNADAERQLVEMVHQGELKNPETDRQALFHPDPANTKGYTLFGWAADNQPADEFTDSEVQHLAVIQGKDGRWFNNIPRPPIQTSDIGPTALAIHALQRYPLPGRQTEFAERVDRARKWLWTVRAENTDERIYQILGLAWAGESPNRLQSLAKSLFAQQRADGGWSQLPTGKSDAFGTGQAVYVLNVGAGIASSEPAIDRARRYLLQTQLEDGTWYVRRGSFPFQPTMKSGFPHGRDGWISAAAGSWAVMALSLSEENKTILTRKPATVARGYWLAAMERGLSRAAAASIAKGVVWRWREGEADASALPASIKKSVAQPDLWPKMRRKSRTLHARTNKN